MNNVVDLTDFFKTKQLLNDYYKHRLQQHLEVMSVIKRALQTDSQVIVEWEDGTQEYYELHDGVFHPIEPGGRDEDVT